MISFVKKNPYLFALLLLGLLAVSIKLSFLPLSRTFDYHRYIETAKLFSSLDVAALYPEYILKPLGPLFVAFFANIFGSFELGFIAQVVFFYFALLLALFAFTKTVLKNDLDAFIASSFFALGYPMLRYGIDLFIETGSHFFFILGLYLAFRFLEKPTKKLFYLNVACVTLGFFWKEYSIVNLIIFTILLLIHPHVPKQEKIKFIGLFNSIFLFAHIGWQGIVYFMFHYTYFQWYGEGVAGFGKEYTPFYLSKSIFALLIAAWPLAFMGYYHFRKLSKEQKLFLYVTIPVPFMALLWGWVSSRLFYVIAAPQVLLAAFGLRAVVKKKGWILFVGGMVLFLNFLWLFLSYRISF